MYFQMEYNNLKSLRPPRYYFRFLYKNVRDTPYCNIGTEEKIEGKYLYPKSSFNKYLDFSFFLCSFSIQNLTIISFNEYSRIFI